MALFLALSAAAQEADSQTQTQAGQIRTGQNGTVTPSNQSRWGVGGSFGTSFGQNWFGFQISPQFVYWLREDLTVGGGMSYSYYRFRGPERYTLNYFGMNGSVHFYPIRNVFIFAQPEVWRRWGHIANARTGSKVFMALPLGAGLMIPTLDGQMQLSFYYDVIQNNYSPHGNGLGISLGFIYRF